MESPEEVEHILKKLEPEEQKMISTFFSGPLPPPDILKEYAEIYPDAPEKLFNWVEEQQIHRHQMEKEYLKKDFNNRNMGMFFGFLIAFTFIVLACILIIDDKNAAGFILMGATIASLAGLFITQKPKSKRETKEDDK